MVVLRRMGKVITADFAEIRQPFSVHTALPRHALRGLSGKLDELGLVSSFQQFLTCIDCVHHAATQPDIEHQH